MQTIRIIVIMLIAVALIATACASPTQPPSPTQQTTTPPKISTPVPQNNIQLPTFAVTSLSQTKTKDSWEISGIIKQREPIMQGLKLDRILIVFATKEGRPCEWRVTDTSPLNGIVEPVSFSLRMTSDTWKDSGFGFDSFQEFQEMARAAQVLVQIGKSKDYLKYGENQYTGEFKADLSNVDPSLLYEAK